MNIGTLTPLESRARLRDMLQLLMSGAHYECELRPKKGDGIFPREHLFKAISQLANEFPVYFPGYLVPNQPLFHNEDLENELWFQGALGVLKAGHVGHDPCVIMEEKYRQIALYLSTRTFNKKELNERLPVVKRFYEIMIDLEQEEKKNERGRTKK